MHHFSHCLIALALVPAPLLAQETRELDAHEHGSGVLNIAMDGGQIAMELEAPGADIVGFEHAATSDEDRATVEAAISDLARPLDLFVLPAAAGCSVTAASVTIMGLGEDGHDDDHGHEEAEHDEPDNGEGGHTEFHAEYGVTCTNPEAIDRIDLAYFRRFPNSVELDVQVVSDAGARSFEVESENPVLDMRGMF